MSFNFPPDHKSPSKKKRAEQKRKIDARKQLESDLDTGRKVRQQKVRDKYSGLGSAGKSVEDASGETSRTKETSASTRSGPFCTTCRNTKKIHRNGFDGSTLEGIGIHPSNKGIEYICVDRMFLPCIWRKKKGQSRR
jgi:hypothetical protein